MILEGMGNTHLLNMSFGRVSLLVVLVAQTHLTLRSVQHMSEAMRRDLLFSHTILKKIDESGISKTEELPILIPLTLSQGLVPSFSRDTIFYYADSWQLSGAWKMFIDFILLLN